MPSPRELLARYMLGGLDPAEASSRALRQRGVVVGVLTTMWTFGFIVVLSDFLEGSTNTVIWQSVSLVMVPLALAVLLLTGRDRLPVLVAIAGLEIGVTGTATDQGGLYGTAMLWQMVVPLVAGTLAGRRGVALGWTAAVMSIVGLTVLHAVGALPVTGHDALSEKAVDGVLAITGGAVATWTYAWLTERTASELEDAVDAAERATEARGAFLATMSHEIRTPLNGIVGAAQLLEDTELDTGQRELIGTVSDGAETLLALLNDVLDLSKLEAERVQLERVPVNLHKLVREIVRPLAVVGSAKGIDVAHTIEVACPKWVYGDPTRLRQILLNLTSNAVKFTSAGSVRVLVAVDADRVVMHVQDSGIGIAPADRDTLFDPFVQADASTNRRFGGTGLGLSIVHRLVVAMDGHIQVDSVVGEGSTFSVTLPLEIAPDQDSLVPLDEAAEVEPRRLLVVDDNPVNRAIAARMLEAEGHTVVVAEGGQQALECLWREHFDVVLLDVQMPEIDGYETARRIRRSGAPSARVPVVALTADAQPEVKRKALAAGMDDFLTKPVRIDELRSAVRRWGDAAHERAA